MKKFILTLFLCFLIFATNAQTKIGVNAGLPVGDISSFYSFSAGVDLYQMFGEPDAFFKFGATAGFLNYFGAEEEVLGQPVQFDDVQFIPLAGVARFTILGVLTFGPDVGYAVGLDDELGGGFYVRSVLGLDFANAVEINTFYHMISFEESNFASIGAGLLVEF